MTSKLKKVRLPTLAGSIIWLACMGLWLIVSTCLNNWAKVSLHYQKPHYINPHNVATPYIVMETMVWIRFHYTIISHHIKSYNVGTSHIVMETMVSNILRLICCIFCLHYFSSSCDGKLGACAVCLASQPSKL